MGLFGRIAGSLKGDRPPSNSEIVAQFWDTEGISASSLYWTAHPLVREYVNELVTGIPWMWPLGIVKLFHAYVPRKHALSVGCGTGELERACWNLRIAEEMLGLDISPESVREARKTAKRSGMKGLKYRVQNCDELRLRANAFDLVFCHASLHHIGNPDRLLAEIARGLAPDGLLFVDDYIGPNRNQWTDAHLEKAREAFGAIDSALHLRPINPPFDYRDPSEMIQSDRIRPAIEANFEIIEFKPYWGNLLYPVISHLNGTLISKPDNSSIIGRLIELERDLVSSGHYSEPLFGVFLARKRSEPPSS